MSNEIKSDKLYIKDIFNRWYRIPEYQRPYVWGKDQINDLLDDISFAQQNDNESEYFLGSIVFQTKTNNNGKYQEDDLLDGQQRLTTLFLITAVIRDLTENEKLKNIELYDEIGKKLKTLPLNYSQNIESLNKGIYYLKIETEKSSTVEKIIKE